MERNTDHREMLETLLCPAFLVNAGEICCANQSAIQRQLHIGDPILPLINIGKEEYAAFTNGRLNLSLTVNGIDYPASIVKFEEMDLFYLESGYEEAELRAFALASQCLREPLSEAMMTIANIQQNKADVQTELAQKLQNISRNLHQFHRALCNMSDVARYDQSRTSRTENRNIVGIIDEIINKATTITAPTQHTLEYHGIQKAILCIIDVEKIERSILNLISNAIKYSPNESTVKASLFQKGDKLYFSVENELQSFADSPNSNIFARYLREPGMDSQNASLGLGLTMIRKAAIAHGGTLLFEQPDSNLIRFTMSIAIKTKSGSYVHSPVLLPIDYAGGFDHLLTELADVLPSNSFE